MIVGKSRDVDYEGSKSTHARERNWEYEGVKKALEAFKHEAFLKTWPIKERKYEFEFY